MVDRTLAKPILYFNNSAPDRPEVKGVQVVVSLEFSQYHTIKWNRVNTTMPRVAYGPSRNRYAGHQKKRNH